jgi:hypothetical protein
VTRLAAIAALVLVDDVGAALWRQSL